MDIRNILQDLLDSDPNLKYRCFCGIPISSPYRKYEKPTLIIHLWIPNDYVDIEGKADTIQEIEDRLSELKFNVKVSAKLSKYHGDIDRIEFTCEKI